MKPDEVLARNAEAAELSDAMFLAHIEKFIITASVGAKTLVLTEAEKARVDVIGRTGRGKLPSGRQLDGSGDYYMEPLIRSVRCARENLVVVAAKKAGRGADIREMSATSATRVMIAKAQRTVARSTPELNEFLRLEGWSAEHLQKTRQEAVQFLCVHAPESLSAEDHEQCLDVPPLASAA